MATQNNKTEDTHVLGRRGPFRYWPVAVTALVAVTAALAWWRVGMLDLPPVPEGVTIESSGLARLGEQRRLDEFVRGGVEVPAEALDDLDPVTVEAAGLAREGIALINAGQEQAGLEMMRDGLRLAPDSLVLSNAYRMEVFALKRTYMQAAQRGSMLAPEFPPHLAGQPIDFLTELRDRQQSRETTLSLALAWVDHMLLFPALEIKAPSSVEAVNLVTGILEGGNPGYVPALFARGLNHLHRPARLVWPEAEKTPPDAAVQDIGRCVAIGRKFDVGSDRLQGVLAIALGDAYVKAGELNVARSWWQIAQNISRDQDLQQAVRRRYGWSDEEILDRLEAELDRARAQLDQPMTDLGMMWGFDRQRAGGKRQ